MANEEDQDGAQRRKNQAGRMISFVSRAKKDVRNAAAEHRSHDAKNHCPDQGHVHVHHRFPDKPRQQPNNQVPNM